jgi:hypothetical protein
MMAAVARIGRKLRQSAQFSDLATFRARRLRPEANPEQMLQTGIIVLKSLKKILNRERFCHREILLQDI